MFFNVLDRKKVTRQVYQEAISIIKHARKPYCADNAIDEATMNLSGFLLAVAVSASPEGAFHRSSSATCIDGFWIERPAL